MDDNFPIDDDVLSADQYEQGINEASDSYEESIETDQEFERLEDLGEDIE